jgi:hypothetical protein
VLFVDTDYCYTHTLSTMEAVKRRLEEPEPEKRELLRYPKS